jgi:cell division septation protein DedD
MLRTGENETEILLGNKQLLGIFLVLAVLLGAAFTGGYVVGRGGTAKKRASASESTASTESTSSRSGGQTHTIPPEGVIPEEQTSSYSEPLGKPHRNQVSSTNNAPGSEAPLGSRKHGESKPSSPTAAPVSADYSYTPPAGTQYLQVAAVGRDEAEAIADVLHKKGFHAHAVPKPGNNKLYRVIIGPLHDAGDLSSTRDALRKTGFREIIVQRY